MENFFLAGFTALFLFIWYLYRRHKARLAFIQTYQFPEAISRAVSTTYPHLDDKQVGLVLDALKSYFLIAYKSKQQAVAMPSQVVDVAWHQFILFTKNYQMFCKKGLGRFLHHTPTEAMKSPTKAQEGIKRTWRLACAQDLINPKLPTKLPMLFAIDALLKIEDGFFYSLNCKDKNSPAYGNNYCASHIGCSSGCSGSSGDSGSDSGCSSGCGGD
ncbi:glycine-rich domain-containing protein [Thalassotalea fusca]